MLPAKNDPRWKALVQGTTDYHIKGLPTRLVVMRARLMVHRKDDKALQDAIDTAYNYFSKNAAIAADDLDAIFGGR